jgi:hypothetical protein
MLRKFYLYEIILDPTANITLVLLVKSGLPLQLPLVSGVPPIQRLSNGKSPINITTKANDLYVATLGVQGSN